MEKRYFVEIPLDCGNMGVAEDHLKKMVEEGHANSQSRIIGVPSGVKDIMGAIEALDDMGDPDSLKILNLLDRLLAEDWSGTGVYEAIDNVLMTAESVVALHKALPFTELSVE